MDITEDRNDTKRAIVTHSPDGEHYIVEYCSLWNEDDQCVGTRIIAAAGPLAHRDVLVGDDFTLEVGWPPPAELFDRIRDWEDLSEEDAEWLQAEEDAGRLQYPIGVR